MPTKLAKLAKLTKQVNVWHLFLFVPVLLLSLEFCNSAFHTTEWFYGMVVGRRYHGAI